MNKEETMLRKRLADLSDQAFSRNIVTFSDFLNLNELNILHTTPRQELATTYQTYGGYEYSERQMAAFLPDALYYDYEYPIRVLEIAPTNLKFAEDLTHRDYLGSLMNLGVDRNRFGDLLVKERKALLFAHRDIADYVITNLNKVKHTLVTVRAAQPDQIDYTPQFECRQGTVASVRLDAVLSVGFSLSRNHAIPYIEGGRVFVNGKLITSNAYALQDGDVISVRGLGRLIYDGATGQTKKGRYGIRIRKFV